MAEGRSSMLDSGGKRLESRIWWNMKKILFCFSSLICLLLVAGCGKNGEKKAPPASAVNQYTLTYTAGPNGTIKGAGTQIVKHGGDGSPVTADAAEHYHFAGWSDGVTSPQRTDRKITAHLKVRANFAIDQYTLTYTAGENGSIEGAGTQKVDYGADGSEVTAVAATGYHFVEWSDGVTTARRTDSDVTADLAVTATFAVNQYTLTYTAGGHGTIKGAGEQTVKHGGDGSPVTAVAAEHYHFAGWSDGVTTPQRTDRKVTADLKVKADFAIDQYNLTYAAGENGSVKGAGTQKVDYGGAGSEVTAVAATGYHFVEWSDGVTTARRTDSDVTAALSVTATFTVNQYTLTYTAGDHGTIEGVSPQRVDYGTDGSAVTAVAEKGYHFVKWSDGGTGPYRVDAKVVHDVSVRAFFAVNTYSVGGRVSGLVDGTRVVLQNNAGDDLAITANGEFNFATELLDASPYKVTVLNQPTSPNQTCKVTSGAGTISAGDVTDIAVDCVLNTYKISGTVSGLPEGDRVVLQNNNSDDLEVTANGGFTFAKPLDDGSDYKVTISGLPKKPNWTCDLENAAGTLAGRDVTDIAVDCFPKVVLQTTAGIRKIKLNWNTRDFGKDVTFNLCRAQEEIPTDGFSGCKDLEGAVLQTKVASPLPITDLTNDIPYWFQMEAHYASGRQTLSEVVKAMPIGGLNDTGLDWCADGTTNRESDGVRSEKTKSCKAVAAAYPGQDAMYGRDASARYRKLTKKGYGAAGFDFTKLCANGEAAGEGKCPPNPSPGTGPTDWACTRDNVTGLTWEVKTNSGLRGQSNTYTWYNPDGKVNGDDPGSKNGGQCEESDCDALAYVQAVNEQGLCGASDWRLPTKKELLSIVDNGRFRPAIETRFFPHTLASYYWTISPCPDQKDSAWQVYFLYGEAAPSKKSQGNQIRLVRGRTVTFGLDNP
jgi:hypothetical protein